ncbi:MAG: CPBP family intramembrane glutamic endopeptidase [Brevefilum sp.]
MNKKSILYLLFTLLITGIFWGSIFFLARAGLSEFGEPIFMILFLLGGFGPTLAPFIAIALIEGKAGLRDYRKRLFKFKVSAWYYLIPLISLLVLGLIPALINNSTSSLLYAFTDTPVLMILVFFIQSILLGGLEELGWRGFLQHELQEKYHLGIVYLIVWVTWTIWHLPLFFIPGVSQYGQNFWVFGIYTLFFSLLLGWAYGRTRSIPVAVFGHALVNLLAAIGYLDFLNKGMVHWLTIVVTLILLLGLHLVWPFGKYSEQ